MATEELAGQHRTGLLVIPAVRLSLQLRRLKRYKTARLRQSKHPVTATNQISSEDFVVDALIDERRLYGLTVVDNYTGESSALVSGKASKVKTW